MAEHSSPGGKVARFMDYGGDGPISDSTSSSKEGLSTLNQFQPASSGTQFASKQENRSARSAATQDSVATGLPSATRFLFVNTTGPEQYIEYNARSRVRSHLMRQVHQEKDKERSHSTVPARPYLPARDSLPHRTPGIQGSGNRPTAGDPVTDQLLPHLVGMEQRLVVPRIITPQSFALGLGDVEKIRQCAKVFDQNSIPMSEEFEAEWFQKASSDRACYHGAMFISTAHRIRAFGLYRKIPPEFYQHKGETIRIIQQRLEDPQARVEDGTLAAIVCLAAFESMMGNGTTASLHIEGIKRLVTMRGGIETLGMAGLLRTMITWADMGNSLAFHRRPYFCPWREEISTLPKELEFLALLESQWQGWPMAQPVVNSLPNFDPFVALIFHRCKQLSTVALRRGPESRTRDRSSYTSYVLILETHIQASLWSSDLNNQRDNDPATAAITRTLHITCLVYLYLALRQIPTEVIIYDSPVTRLKLTLESLDQSHFLSVFEGGLFLWVLIIGGVAACGRAERGWFVKSLMRMIEVMGLKNWEDVIVVMREYPWVENSFAALAKGLWEESDGQDEVFNTYR